MADAKGAFVTRALEKIVSEAPRKYAPLHKACKAYLDRPKHPAPFSHHAKDAQGPDPSATEEVGELDDVKLDSPKAEVSQTTTTPPASPGAGSQQGGAKAGPASPTPSSPLGSPGPALHAASTMASAGSRLTDADAEVILLPLQLACETKLPKLVETALDCIHKLIAYGHLVGETGLEDGSSSKTMTEVFAMVCGCADIPSDSAVLQVIKVLLTAVASSTFQVHGESLLLAVRTCYNISLGSKNPVNSATAKATLTQMISLVFQRMDPHYEEAGLKGFLSPRIPGSPTAASVSGSELASGSLSPERSSATTKLATGAAGGIPVRLLDNGVLPPAAATAAGDGKVTVEQLTQLAGGADIRGLEAALEKVAHPEGVAPGEQLGPEGIGPLSQTGLSQAERDGLMMIRALCRLSMKDSGEGVPEGDIINRGKQLSLELLEVVLAGAGRSFVVRPCFLEAVKCYIPHTLLRACVSPVPAIFERACAIFIATVLHFRDILKAEIAIFFPLVVLRSLDSGDGALHQRQAVLAWLQKLCADPQALVDLFVNYDCDLAATNLFERMITSLSRIAQGVPGMDPSSAAVAQNVSVKTASLQCLVGVLATLSAWTKKQGGGAVPAAVAVAVAEAKVEGAGTGGDAAGAGAPASADEEGLEERDSQADKVEKAKVLKISLQSGVSEFNRKPEKGLKILQTSGLVGSEATDVARFLSATPGLDKVAVGDYLGGHEEFNLKVMHAFVDVHDFKGLEFDAAIRAFLAVFRLPGEAQKIDRIMEKFAEKFCRDNPGIFKNADAAYVLAYAIIMLNTDAHNPMVWPKMSKADFVRMNAPPASPTPDAAPSEGIPVPMLEGIYDRIVTNEIKLRDEDTLHGGKGGAGAGGGRGAEAGWGLMSALNLAMPRKGAVTDEQERSKEGEAIVKRVQALFQQQQQGAAPAASTFQSATERGLVRPIMEAVGWSLLAAFSVTMEDSDNRLRVAACLDGFKFGIQLTAALGMETMRSAYLTALIRLTGLHHVAMIRAKSVEALRMLLWLAESEPHCMQDSWYAVLECVSRLDDVVHSPEKKAAVMSGANQTSREVVLATMTDLAGMPSERIFVNTVRLPSDAVVEFFMALCRISEEELRVDPQHAARVFSLQKLVEISYYNITRIRMVWSRIWAVLSSHFVAAGGHPDQQIAMYAIDSLRQLGIKYLERAELANFTFQNDILKPFVVIMRTSGSDKIREMVVQCVVQMIRSRVGSIKSGWRSVFMVFTTAANDGHEEIVEHAFVNVEQVVLEHFDQVVGDCFMDCVNCLIAFANNKLSGGISLKAIALLRICEDRLAEGLIPGGQLQPVVEGSKKHDSEVAEYYWFPMLAGLSDLTSDPRPDVRGCALEVLFDLCKERGSAFSTSFWESVFQRVLFPIFDYVRHAGKTGKIVAVDAWLRDTCIHCLQLLCDLFCDFYRDVSFMLPSLLGLLLDCATRPDQGLAAISVAALVRLMDVGGPELTEADWTRLIGTLRNACDATQPVELLHPEMLGRFRGDANGDGGGEGGSGCEGVGALGEAVREDRVSRRSSMATVTPMRVSFMDEASGSPDGPVPPDGGQAPSGPPNGVPGSEPGGAPGSDTGPSGDVGGGPGSAGRGGQGDGEGQGGSFLEKNSMMSKVLSTLLLRNLTSGRQAPRDAQPMPTQPPLDDGGLYAELAGPTEAVEISSAPLDALRCKCAVQLLLLDALNKLQANHWSRLLPQHKRMIMDLSRTMVEFPSAFNNNLNLRRQLQRASSENPSPTLLRQEVTATSIYLSILLQVLGERGPSDGGLAEMEKMGDLEPTLREEAESRLVRLCSVVLERSTSRGAGAGAEKGGKGVQQGPEMAVLQAPVLIQVLLAMQRVTEGVFRKHLHSFYPQFTLLISSDQVDVRRSLGDLFASRLPALLP